MRAITVSGFPGSGTTTLCKLLSEKLKIAHTNTGEIFRNMAKEMGKDLAEFGRYVDEHPEIDKELDRRQTELAKQGEIILEGRLSGAILYKENIPSFKIWLTAPKNIRWQRVAQRENIDIEEARNKVEEREGKEIARYIRTYNIDLNNVSIYDLVIDTSCYTPEEIVEIILNKLKSME